jgi:hypothetical protein
MFGRVVHRFLGARFLVCNTRREMQSKGVREKLAERIFEAEIEKEDAA